ncbi:MAG: trigger factor [Candidatus Reconcilbacillus cellulovorans]|uniref:Trigger factor n=1 Tax=Candidatus Reconcilbacillus cellulovorans TaxID=1906605 RepID=A0A2A6E219_9BACL|nr:MAG: trigger factor [Candidatus Reconcilbacillus cellulovorans]
MKATWEKLENNRVVLHVEIGEDKVAEALDKAFRKVVRRVTVPGFRKGKVPRAIFERRFGPEALYQDALDILLPESYAAAVEQCGIEPVDRPSIDIERFGKGEPFVFKATVTVKPEVKLGVYKGLEVSEGDVSVTDAELEEELKRLQERHAEIVSLEGEPVRNGDFAFLSVEAFVDGRPVKDWTAERMLMMIGSGSMPQEFEQRVLEMSKGEEKQFEIDVPEQFEKEDVRGKTVSFRVKLIDFKRKRIPELDDEFAKDISEFDTLDELKADLRKRLEERKAAENRRRKEDELVEKAMAACEVDIPAVMIENELQRLVDQFDSTLRLQGLNLEQYYRLTRTTPDQLKERLRPTAEKNVRSRLVLEAIARAENLEATDEELQREIEAMAEQLRIDANQLRARLEETGGLRSVKRDIAVRKAIEFLLANSRVA